MALSLPTSLLSPFSGLLTPPPNKLEKPPFSWFIKKSNCPSPACCSLAQGLNTVCALLAVPSGHSAAGQAAGRAWESSFPSPVGHFGTGGGGCLPEGQLGRK